MDSVLRTDTYGRQVLATITIHDGQFGYARSRVIYNTPWGSGFVPYIMRCNGINYYVRCIWFFRNGDNDEMEVERRPPYHTHLFQR